MIFINLILKILFLKELNDLAKNHNNIHVLELGKQHIQNNCDIHSSLTVRLYSNVYIKAMKQPILSKILCLNNEPLKPFEVLSTVNSIHRFVLKVDQLFFDCLKLIN